MDQITVSGLDHPLAAALVLHQLVHSSGDIVCHAQDDVTGAMQAHLRARVGELLRQRETRPSGADSTGLLMGRLHFAPATLPGTSGGGRHFHFLSAAMLSTILRSDARIAQALPDHPPGQMILVFDRHQLPAQRSVASCMDTIGQVAGAAAHADSRLYLYCVGACFDDGALAQPAPPQAASPLDTLATEAAGLIEALRRRAPDYLARYPLRVRQHGKHQLRVMPASGAAALLAGAGTVRHAKRNLVFGAQAIAIGSVVGEVVRAAGGVLETACTGQFCSMAANMLDEAMTRAGAHAGAEADDFEGARIDGYELHLVRAPAADLSLLLRGANQAVTRQTAQTPCEFASLPGMARHASQRDQLHYYSYGSGDQVLLLVNAFGLTLDFWQMLVASLGAQCRIIALERRAAAADGVPASCYSSTDYLAEYPADCIAVLDENAIRSCHVASWCSGAKFALELAVAHPSRIASLSLLAPSFAGIDGFAGDDSAYEKHLFSMCKLVNKMPKTAAIMAATMLPVLEKNSQDVERFDPSRKDAVDVLELADAVHLQAICQPFSSAPNLIEFSRQLLHFRQHDIRAALGAAGVQLPVMLVTGSCDSTTSNARAKDICGGLRQVVGFDIEGASHYLVHQDYRLVGMLLSEFMREGITLKSHGLRIKRTLFRHGPDSAPATLAQGARP